MKNTVRWKERETDIEECRKQEPRFEAPCGTEYSGETIESPCRIYGRFLVSRCILVGIAPCAQDAYVGASHHANSAASENNAWIFALSRVAASLVFRGLSRSGCHGNSSQLSWDRVLYSVVRLLCPTLSIFCLFRCGRYLNAKSLLGSRHRELKPPSLLVPILLHSSQGGKFEKQMLLLW